MFTPTNESGNFIRSKGSILSMRTKLEHFHVRFPYLLTESFTKYDIFFSPKCMLIGLLSLLLSKITTSKIT